MAVVTPVAQDRPDWVVASSYFTDFNEVGSGPIAGFADLGTFDIGAAPAFGFQMFIHGGPWQLWLTYGPDPPLFGHGFTGQQYRGSTDCFIHDNVPTPAQYVNVKVFADNPLQPVTPFLGWWLSQTQQPGATINPAQGLAIDVTAGNCPAHSVTNFPSEYLLPGIHQYCFDANATINGVANLSGLFGGVLHGRMVRLFNPAVAVGYDGQVIVSNVQPVWQVVNNAAVAVTVNATLTKGF